MFCSGAKEAKVQLRCSLGDFPRASFDELEGVTVVGKGTLAKVAKVPSHSPT